VAVVVVGVLAALFLTIDGKPSEAQAAPEEVAKVATVPGGTATLTEGSFELRGAYAGR
jgi:hypothetical protein